ncbi:DinB family protein [Cytobacillus gottheilii]|uniref:DinB family protein n=1 Tax=Cytobacillus gottheilii TaxID=859144 RepID=UPI00082F7848|nr:DinB family protein [Cytobacillus gottheilii]
MYRQVNDFLNEWNAEAVSTIAVMDALTDEKLEQAITEGHSTLRWLGWHLATSPVFFASLVGVNLAPPTEKKEEEMTAADIQVAYRKIAEELKSAAESTLADEQLTETIDFGGPTAKGSILSKLILHQTHHRGQMTVLLRQAGLPVPGVMGPTKEQQQG